MKTTRRIPTSTLARLAARAELICAWLVLDDLDAREVRRLYARARRLVGAIRGADLDTFHRRHYARTILGAAVEVQSAALAL